MTRYRFGAGFSLRDAAVPGRVGAHQARPARRRKLRFQFERLEERIAMDGDSTLVADPPADDVAEAAPANPAADDVSALPLEELSDRFASQTEFEAWLIEAAQVQWGHLFGRSLRPDYRSILAIEYVVAVSPATTIFNSFSDVVTFSGASAAFDGTRTTTNLQVAGVDEADLVETDGEYLYILSGDELVIVEAGIGDDLRVLSRYEVGGNVIGMYLDGDRLAIVSNNDTSNTVAALRPIRDFGYGTFSYAHPTTTVTVLDVADRSAPTLVQKTEMDGRLVDSRVVDGELRLVLSQPLKLPPPIARALDGGGTVAPNSDGAKEFKPLAGSMLFASDDWNPTPVAESVYETLDEYVARIKEEIFKTATPSARVLGTGGEVVSESALVDATDIYRPESFENRTFTTVATFDLASNTAGPVDTKAVFTQGTTQVYATKESLYLFSVSSQMSNGYIPATDIHKFSFDAESHEILRSARGSVNGMLLNQFSADEHEGYLRLVTETSGWNGVNQSVFVLEQVGKRLEVVGSIEGLAPSEQIYSVRFMGDRAFLVTFRVVDPLFALDLSDPTDPKLMGELKIPGFSDYLQPIDENHLLAIGRGADEQSGLFEELQVSIFNIADLENPVLAHRYSFEEGWAMTTLATGDRWTRGDGDHHALSFFAEAGLLALPVANSGSEWWEAAGGLTPRLESGESGLMLFQIDVTAGFSPIGFIQHETQIQRSLQIDGHLYAISGGRVSVHEMMDPTVELGTLSIADVVPAPIVEWPTIVDPIIVTLPWLPIDPLVVVEIESPIAELPLETRLPIETGLPIETWLLPIETWLPIDPIELIDPVIAVDPLLPVESIPDIVSGFYPIQVTTIFTPVEVPITDPVSLPITPVVEVAEIDAAVDVVGEAIVVEASQETEQVALPYLPQLNLRSTTRPRVEQLARFDAFESFDNLLVLSASMADLADHSVNSMRSLAAEGLEGDTAELGDWGAIVDALAAESLLAELAV